ncbi:TPA: hypothetical protein QHL04_002675 [Klebsiella aerogenes]|uniref:hypothetical protein n=1 Tax=Klebsiella aerogenes TaxID=548 RepID=UPI001865D44F|nr:hypothetical protein [Klebsiella aerogenes]MDG0008039.1 hypothetical protein [Klebsiella aerogenes]HDS4383777.1 hypothetical protein [Klebsiella aerogenes]HDT4368096.1 hypothetical protein [Klebsiella aerogenes]
MDIVNLIELLKPADHLVTVKLMNDSEPLDEVGKFLISILPAIVSLVALYFSYIQFKQNLANQTESFKKNADHQIKIAELNAKLNTEVELIKSRCDSIRQLCVECMTHASDLSDLCDKLKEYENSFGNVFKSTSSYKEGHAERASRRDEKFNKLFASQTLLYTYIDADKDPSFYSAINNLCNYEKISKSSGAEIGAARGTLLAECRIYLKKRDEEISKLIRLSSQ